MPIICRVLQIAPNSAASLVADRNKLEETVKSAKIYSGVYRYWHGIEYLLAQHSPGSPAAKWLSLGQAVSKAVDSIPAARVLAPEQVAELETAIREIEPDALAEHYDAPALDEAGIYPRMWVEWEKLSIRSARFWSTTAIFSFPLNSARPPATRSCCTSLTMSRIVERAHPLRAYTFATSSLHAASCSA